MKAEEIKEEIIKQANDSNLDEVQLAYLDGFAEKVASSGLEKQALLPLLPFLGKLALGGLAAHSGAKAIGAASQGNFGQALMHGLGAIPGAGLLGKGISSGAKALGFGNKAISAGNKMTQWAGGPSRIARWGGAGYGMKHPLKTLGAMAAVPWAIGKVMGPGAPARPPMPMPQGGGMPYRNYGTGIGFTPQGGGMPYQLGTGIGFTPQGGGMPYGNYGTGIGFTPQGGGSPWYNQHTRLA
jgi:hypothetical protein